MDISGVVVLYLTIGLEGDREREPIKFVELGAWANENPYVLEEDLGTPHPLYEWIRIDQWNFSHRPIYV